MSNSKSSAKVTPLDGNSAPQVNGPRPPTGKKRSPKDKLDVYVIFRTAGSSVSHKTQTLPNAGLSHLVTPAQLPGQRVVLPREEVEASNGALEVVVFDDDEFSGDDLVGTFSGTISEVLSDAAPGPVVKRLKLRHGENDIFAGNVDVKVAVLNDGSVEFVVQKLLELRDVDAVTDLRGHVDMVPVYVALAVLIVYYVIGIVFYSLAPMALRDNSTSEDVALSCVAGNLTETVSYSYGSPTDDMLATCDQSTNDGSWTDCSGFVDAFYFVTATLTTVGYGDMGPGNIDARAFSIVFAFFSTAYVGTALGIISGFLMDRQEALEQQLKKSGKKKEDTPTMKQCKRTCKCLFTDSGKSAIRASVSLGVALVVGMIFYYIELAAGQNNSQHATFINLLYYATITSTTIGYGDEAPVTIAGRVFGTFYMLFAVVSFGVALSALADIPLARRRSKMERKVLQQFGDSLSILELQNLIRTANDDPNDDTCSKAEFVISMLLKLDKVKPDQIKSLQETFDNLDIDKSGTLSLVDVTETEESLIAQDD